MTGKMISFLSDGKWQFKTLSQAWKPKKGGGQPDELMLELGCRCEFRKGVVLEALWKHPRISNVLPGERMGKMTRRLFPAIPFFYFGLPDSSIRAKLGMIT